MAVQVALTVNVDGQPVQLPKEVQVDEQLDQVLQKISLAFGIDNLEVVFPEDLLVELSLYRVAKIDTSMLDEEMIFHGKVYMLFEVILSYMSDKLSRAEAQLNRVEAQLSLKHEKYLASTGERVSDKKIEKLVEADEDYIEAVNIKLDYKRMANTFQNILMGLDEKGNILQQLSAKRNKEIAQRNI